MPTTWTWGRGLRTGTITAIVTALYVGFAMPITAMAFFELYHATHIEFIYSVYVVFKAAGALLPEYGYLMHAVIAAALISFCIALVISRIRGR